MTILLTLSASQSRHFQEIGILIAAVAGVVLAVGAVLGIMEASRTTERGVVLAAGVLLAVGMVLAVYGLHRGF